MDPLLAVQIHAFTHQPAMAEDVLVAEEAEFLIVIGQPLLLDESWPIVEVESNKAIHGLSSMLAVVTG